MVDPGAEAAAEAMRRRAAAWKRGAVEGRAADRVRWSAMTPAERVEEALELVDQAERMRRERDDTHLAR
jgi:hypothetical protein